MTVCLIITTYNWPGALELCLKSVLRQKIQPDEVIIADDGSGPETKSLIDSYRPKFKNLMHAWHEDHGYQRAKIINLAISMSTSDFIITTDQDCILHRHYVQDYILQAEEGSYISAYRINVKKGMTEKLLRTRRLPTLLDLLTGTRLNYKYQVRRPSKWKERSFYISDISDGTYGCNMGFFRKDVLEINGYNEDFVGWGPEDSEMTQRLINSGKKWKRIYFSAILYHLYHPQLQKDNLAHNVALVKHSIANKTTYVTNGIKKGPKENQ